jgi:hypothetical protein
MTTKKQTATEWALEQKYGDESVTELYTRLTTPTLQDNPSPAKLLPEPVSFDKIRSVVSDEEAFKVLSNNIWDLTAAALNRGDMSAVKGNIGALVAGKCLTPETAGKIAKLFTGKVPDPTWETQINVTPLKAAGYEALSIADLEEAEAKAHEKFLASIPDPATLLQADNAQSSEEPDSTK